jgi:hypothetical protein
MCNLYSVIDNRRSANSRVPGGIQPSRHPDYSAPIVRCQPGGRELTMARWGMPSPATALQGRKARLASVLKIAHRCWGAARCQTRMRLRERVWTRSVAASGWRVFERSRRRRRAVRDGRARAGRRPVGWNFRKGQDCQVRAPGGGHLMASSARTSNLRIPRPGRESLPCLRSCTMRAAGP